MSPPDTADGPIPLEELRSRLEAPAAGAGLGRVTYVAPIAVAGASLTYRAALQGGPHTEIVVKIAPPGLEPVRNRDVLRQARALKAAGRIEGVRVPTVLFEDAGVPPEVPPLFAMTMEAGECLEPIFDGPALPPVQAIRGRALSAAEILGKLHSAQPARIQLEEPATSLEDELARWVRAFATVDESFRGRADDAAQVLADRLPTAAAPALLHGDYRLGNMLCDGDAVTAIIDWELWSVSDPRLDLAWFLLHRDHRANPHAGRPAPGMPSAGDLIGAYADARRCGVGELAWFEALVRFKQAAAGALILKRLVVSDQEREVRAIRLRTEVKDALEILES